MRMLVYFTGSSDKNSLMYKCGEKMTFNLELVEDGKPISCPKFKWYMSHDRDDGGDVSETESEGFVSGESGKITLTTVQDCPGFVRLRVIACDEDGNAIKGAIPFEGGAGADVDRIEEGVPDPADFDEFWEKQREVINGVKPEVLMKTKVDSNKDGYDAYDMRILSPGGVPVSGILTLPHGAAPASLNAKLLFHGYGTCSGLPVCIPDTAVFFINIHGNENLREDEYYAEFGKKVSGFGFNKDEYSNPETSYFMNVILRDIQGARYISSIPEYNGRGVALEGPSMGGMQAAIVAAQIDNASEVYIEVPWMCDLGGFTRGRIKGWIPDLCNGLLYFDTAKHAKRIKCPVEIYCGIGDYTCPPSTEVVLFQNLKYKKKITFVQNRTHSYQLPEVIKYCFEGKDDAFRFMGNDK